MSMFDESEDLDVGGQLPDVNEEGEEVSPGASGTNSPPSKDLGQEYEEHGELDRTSTERWEIVEDAECSPSSRGGESPMMLVEVPPAPVSEEEVLKDEAAKWIQRTVRGHASRRAAQFTMIWPLYPSPIGQYTWGYQGFWHIKSVQALQEEYEFKERLELLDQVLHNGLEKLPHLFSKDIGRPLARRKARAQFLQELIRFCLLLAAAYWNEGLVSPANFLWSSVVALCTMPPIIDDVSASKKRDSCNFKEKTASHIYALDQLAMLCYRQQDFQTAQEHIEKALDLCMARVAGRLPFCVVTMHKALILAALQQNERSLLLLEENIPVLSTVEENPMGEVELLEARKVISHVLLTCVHNFSVQLRVVGRLQESQQAAENCFVMVAKACHSAQPVSKIMLHSFAASLRQNPSQSAATVLGYGSTGPDEIEGKSSGATRMLAVSALLGDGKKSNSFHRAPSAGPEKNWRKWLNITVKESPYIAPLWLQSPLPAFELSESAAQAYDNWFSSAGTAGKVIEGMKSVMRRQDSEEVPAEVLEAVCKCVLKLCEESEHLLRQGAEGAREKISEIQTLMTRTEVPFVDQLPWWVRAHATLCIASFQYQHEKDFRAAREGSDRALAICQTIGGGYLGALAGVNLAASFIREGEHEKAFHAAKEALVFCKESTLTAQAESLELEANVGKRREREDILVAASHAMALSHLLLGLSDTALRLSRTASEHVQRTSYNDHSDLPFLQVSRVYELALSISEMAESRTRPFAPKSRQQLKAPAPSKLDPANFVPGVLRRNLPEGSMEYMGSETSSVMARYDERIVRDRLEEDEDECDEEEEERARGGSVDGDTTEALPKLRGKQYKWSGRHAALLGAASDSQIDAPGMQYGRGGGVRQREELYALNGRGGGGGRSGGMASMRRAPSMPSPPKTITPYGEITLTPAQVAASGALPPPPGISSRSEWVDQLLELDSGRGSSMKRDAPDDQLSKLYFAQVFKSARDNVFQLADPLEEPSRRRFRVGDHGRMRKERRASERREKWENEVLWRSDRAVEEGVVGGRGSAEEESVLRRSWAPDPASHLLRESRLRGAQELQRLRGGARSLTPSLQESGASSLRGGEGGGRRGGGREREEKLDWVNLRIEKHMPYDQAVRRSALGLFYSAKDRKDLLAAVEEYTQRPLSSHAWDRARPGSDRPSSSSSKREKAIETAQRPFYWSHRPDESHYLHTMKGRAPTNKANTAYRALPYGNRLSPAGKQAYGTTNAPTLGPNALQSMKVDPSIISQAVELADVPLVSPSHARSLTSFY